jgi:hypothetical protein
MESRCRYTRINGARCAMPALNGHDLCYERLERKRQAQRKPVPSDPKASGPLVNLVYMDDHTSVLANLNAVAEAFAYGHIDHRQLSALTRLMQTCLKTLHQKHDLELNIHSTDRVHEVTYDEDGLALAVDPPPAPAREAKPKSRRPRYADIGFGNTVAISAGAAPQPAARPAPKITAAAAPEPAANPASPDQQPTFFQTLTSKSKDNPLLFKHLRYSPESDRLFSDTYLPPEGIDVGEIASLSACLQKLIADAVLGSAEPISGLCTPRKNTF